MNSSTRSSRTPARVAVGSGLALVGGVALALAAPLGASAHVTATPSTTAAGAYSIVTFSVGHGCDGSSTTGMTITIPEGISSVTPTVNPNWDVTKNKVTLDTPITDSHGASITERVESVTYTAKTPLADGFRDTFALQVQLPEDAAGETLAFPALQTCEVGSTDWSEPTVEGEEEPELPAPTVTVTAAEEGAGHHGGAESDETDADTAAGAEQASASSEAASTDVLARVLGIAGLVVGVVGIVAAVATRRQRNA